MTITPNVQALIISDRKKGFVLSIPVSINQLILSRSKFRKRWNLLPNQTKYLAVPTFNIKDEIAYSELQLPDPLPWQRRLSIPTVNITQSSPTYTQQALPPAFVISGDFSNQTPYQLKKVRLVFVLYDGNGKIIDSSQRDEFSVNPFERRSYTQLWPNINGSNVAKADIKIYTDNLDPQNLVAPQIPSGSSSDLGRPTFNR